MEPNEIIPTESEGASFGLAELFHVENNVSAKTVEAVPRRISQVVTHSFSSWGRKSSSQSNNKTFETKTNCWRSLATKTVDRDDEKSSPVTAKTDNWRNISGQSHEPRTKSWRSPATSNDHEVKKKPFDVARTTQNHESGPSRSYPHGIEKWKENAKNPNIEPKELCITRKVLSEMCSMNGEKIIIILVDQEAAVGKLLDTDVAFHDLILLLRIIAKVCESSFRSNTTNILNGIFIKKFLAKLKLHICTLAIQNDEEKQLNALFWKDNETFWKHLLTLFETVLTLMPNTACEVLTKITKTILIVIDSLEKDHDISSSSHVVDGYTNFAEKLTAFASRPDKNIISVMQPRDNFRDYAIYPSLVEITTRDIPFIRPIIKEGAYQSVEHYLDVQFRLLREDFVASLRDGICTYLENKETETKTKPMYDVCIYERVQFVGPYVTHDRIATLVQYTKRRKPKVDDDSTSFIYGSLVCFTRDNFKTVIFGTIVDSACELHRNGQIVVDFSENIVYGANYTMVECKVFFEPYLQTLSALQGMDESNFPFKKYIIDVNTEVDPPGYINASTTVSVTYNILCDTDLDEICESFPILSSKNEPTPYKLKVNPLQCELLKKKFIRLNRTLEIYTDLNIDKSFKILSPETWPLPDELKLNPSQYKAFQNALTKEFCVIQGPPGTGKTYTTHRIVEFLLDNKSKMHFRGPILVICFTNHALDQFLEGILPYTCGLVRVGGQSKTESLNEYNLKYHRKTILRNMKEKMKKNHELDGLYCDDFSFDDSFYNNTSKVLLKRKDKVDKILEKIRILQQLLEDISSNSGIIRFEFFKQITDTFDDTNLEYLPDNRIIDWLIEGQVVENHVENVVDEQNENAAIYYRVRNPRPLDNDDFWLNNFLISEFQLGKQIFEINMKIIKLSKTIGNNREILFYTRELQRLNENFNYLRWRLHQNNQVTPPVIIDDDIYSLSFDDRWNLYRYCLNLLTETIYEKMYTLDKQYRAAYNSYKEILNVVDIEIMRDVHVIGMTTTGAARLHDVLLTLDCPIVIVEEAAEVLEAHVVVSVTRNCEHLILIGDHKQLRPSTAQYELARKYNLDISLFERMVSNDIFCQQLDVQHRMRPEIAKLLVPTIYAHLDNHSSVMEYPPVLGVTKNLFFINHSNYEEKLVDNTSHINKYEARYLLKLASYFLKQGYKAEDITILTTYTGQMSYMLKERKFYLDLKNVKIVTVDNFQGEESKIILLSLVRSNEEANIGFLKTANRVCVALSRAREGFFIIGNMDNLSHSSTLWKKIKAVLVEEESIGTTLVLQCQVHENETKIEKLSDFDGIDGGCTATCDELLDCGHTCVCLCHALDREHTTYECEENCTRNICTKGLHSCPQLCFVECGDCIERVPTDLPCGHTGAVPCNIKTELYQCPTLMLKKLSCGHEANIQCFETPDEAICPHDCEIMLPCGHNCKNKCHIKVDPQHLQSTCNEPCNKSKKDCSTQGHPCPNKCFEGCAPCEEPDVQKKRTLCGHTHRVLCNENVDKLTCRKNCRKLLPCGHHCHKKCFEDCGSCNVWVSKIIEVCGHSIKTSCSAQPDRKRCRENCPLLKTCGHPCALKCNVPCSDVPCTECAISKDEIEIVP